MTERQVATARKVVRSFRELLGPQARREVTEDEFQELELLIQEALSEEVHRAAEQVEAVAHRLRAESDLPELGL